MSNEKTRAKERGLLLGTACLFFYLCLIVQPARALGVAQVPLRLWLAALGLTLLVQGLLWWLLHRRPSFVERRDPHFLHFPVLAASVLLNAYLYVAPDTRLLLLFAWILVLLFGSGRVGGTEVMVWSTVQLSGYLAVLFTVRHRIADFSLADESVRLWMFLGVCVGMAVLFERQRQWVERARSVRLRSEETLRESEGRLRQVIDLVPHLIFAKDQEGRFILANHAVAEAYGTTIEELLTKTDADFAASEEEVRHFRADDREVIASGKPKLIPEERLTDASGKERILRTTKIPFRTGSAEPTALLGVAIDITEVKHAEQQRLQLEAQMQYLQKLESLGVLAGGVAHDFNNILVPVLGYAELALADLSESSPARPKIQSVLSAAERAADLVHQLLAYSGQGQFLIQRLDLSRITYGVSDLISASISKKAEVRVSTSDGDVYVEADPEQLHQVLMNLMTNASEALADRKGQITVTTGQIRADRDYLDGAVSADHLPVGEYAYLEVADDGCGMSAETRARIFDPFYSTKFAGRGLGLAAVMGIARGHGGAIRVDSEEGKGTTIRLLLPLAAPPSKPDRPAVAEVEPDRLPAEPIMVADDDPAVREFVTEALERSGGSVVLARDGAEAIEIYRSRADDIAMVLLDMTMPEMSGAEALRALRKIRPEVRVVMMSGFSKELATADIDGSGPDAFLHKPFSSEALTRMISEVLAAH